jgi:hypothetical protein
MQDNEMVASLDVTPRLLLNGSNQLSIQTPNLKLHCRETSGAGELSLAPEHE